MLDAKDKKRITSMVKIIEDLKASLKVEEALLQEEYYKYEPAPIYRPCKVHLLGDDLLYITTGLANACDKKEFMSLFGSISGSWDKLRKSVKYFRISDVLLHKGGGWLLLKDQQPCSDEEWESIKAGDVPEKFRNNTLAHRQGV